MGNRPPDPQLDVDVHEPRVSELRPVVVLLVRGITNVTVYRKFSHLPI